MTHRLLFILYLLFGQLYHAAAQRHVTGKVQDLKGQPIAAAIQISGSFVGTQTNPTTGEFSLKAPGDSAFSLLISAIGYLKLNKKVSAGSQAVHFESITLREDAIGLEQVTVSATRNKVALHESPTLINVIDKKVFEAVQATSLSQGLQFSPGLRIENNCQNCGFSSIRMNGLQGPYTQMLINSRPVYSALAGVYGLEQIPANMVERVEVVRGGGSVLYGGNAIAGIVNVITSDPVENSAQVSEQFQRIGGQASEHYLTGNAAWTNASGNFGGQAFATYRNRQPWDANADGFSELTKIDAKAGGAGIFYKPNKNHRFHLQTYAMQEFRRGGSHFDRVPHLASIAEQLEHKLGGAQWSFEGFVPGSNVRWSVYQGLQLIDRKAYYGGLGRDWNPGEALTEEDRLAENAYGNTQDVSMNSGIQVSKSWKKYTLTSGVEHMYNRVNDQYPGYGRSIKQKVQTIGAYSQLEWLPGEKWHFTAGGRFDQVFIDGLYQLQTEPTKQNIYLPVFVPRFTALHKYNPFTNWRLSVSKGYRAPQAFDEDLHIQTVGGTARYIELTPELKPEHSVSLSASFDKTVYWKDWQMNFILEGFHTELRQAFALVNPRLLPEVGNVITKVNSAGARVFGSNAELKLAHGKSFLMQFGGTLQQAQFVENQVIWTSLIESEMEVSSKQMLRTPHAYGYAMFQWTPIQNTTIFMTHTLTGSMLVPRLIDVETQQPELVRTPGFWDVNLKVSREFKLNDSYALGVNLGVNNVFNSFQSDFQKGPLRDATYVYGPILPRTMLAGLVFKSRK